MRQALKPACSSLSGVLTPFLDSSALRKAGISPEQLCATATRAFIATLSKDFVVTPREPLTAVLREGGDNASADALASRIAVLEIALAAARLR